MKPLPPATPEAIKHARLVATHSVVDAAATVHVSRETWHRWESGAREMPLAAWELYLIKTKQRTIGR